MKKLYALLALGIVCFGYAQTAPTLPKSKNKIDPPKVKFKPLPKLESTQKQSESNSFSKKPKDSEIYVALTAPKRNDKQFNIPNAHKPEEKRPSKEELQKLIEKK